MDDRIITRQVLIEIVEYGEILTYYDFIGWSQSNPLLGNGESVPFRFTPNIQDYITPVGIEGLFTSSLMATARSLTEPELELDQYLSLFIRDELITWHMSNHRPVTDSQFHERLQANIHQVMSKAQFLSCKVENDNVSIQERQLQQHIYLILNAFLFYQTINTDKPVSQNVIDLISQSSNPQKMAQMECTWMPWL